MCELYSKVATPPLEHWTKVATWLWAFVEIRIYDVFFRPGGNYKQNSIHSWQWRPVHWYPWPDMLTCAPHLEYELWTNMHGCLYVYMYVCVVMATVRMNAPCRNATCWWPVLPMRHSPWHSNDVVVVVYFVHSVKFVPNLGQIYVYSITQIPMHVCKHSHRHMYIHTHNSKWSHKWDETPCKSFFHWVTPRNVTPLKLQFRLLRRFDGTEGPWV